MGTLADFSMSPWRVVAHAHVVFTPELRASLNGLQESDADELNRASLAANALMDHCATAVNAFWSRCVLTAIAA